MINKKHFLRSFVSLTCIAALIFAQIPVSAAPSSKELKKKTSHLENELNSLNSELQSLGDELDKTASEIKTYAKKVEKTKLDLASAKLNEEMQYEAMSERIKFMYEGGSLSLLHILFTSESMGDFLNKAEYVTSISNYDRDMLKDFKNVRINIEEKQKKLEEQRAELNTLQETLTAKEAALKSKISSTSASLSDYQNQLARAKAAEEALKQAQDNETSGSVGDDKPSQDTTKKDNVSDKDSENKTPESEDSKDNKDENTENDDAEKEETSDEENISDEENTTDEDSSDEEDDLETDNVPSKPASVSDVALLAAIIQCEAGSSYDGMMAVGTVIMNRVSSSRFPNTIKEVVYQRSQFGPVTNGSLSRVLAEGASSSAYSAAQEILGGKRVSKIKDCLFFNGASWTNHAGVNIGGNIFW